jgi:hypothetical protein
MRNAMHKSAPAELSVAFWQNVERRSFAQINGTAVACAERWH